MVEFKMAAIIKLSQNEWVKFFFVQIVGTNLGKHQWVWEEKLRWLNPRWPNSRWPPSSSWDRMNEWRFFFMQMVGTNLGKCEWVCEEKLRWLNPRWQNSRWLPSSSWVRMNEWSFFVQIVGTNLGKCEWVCEEKLRWLNPRWPNSRWQNSRWPPSSSSVRMNEFESHWISLSQSQSGVSVFEWIWEKKTSCPNPTWWKLNPRWQNSR